MAASEAAVMPLPSEETTPPVTKIKGVLAAAGGVMRASARWKPVFYRFVPGVARLSAKAIKKAVNKFARRVSHIMKVG
jgi:hypothetical protein